jgi:hypothetical protein
MGDLREPASLFCIQIDVVYPERCGNKALCVDRIEEDFPVWGVIANIYQILEVIELYINFDFMILERDQR